MKHILIGLMLVSLVACVTPPAKKEQLMLQVDPSLMIPAPDLNPLKETK